MLASSLAGLIWYKFGSSATFLTTSVMTMLVMIYFLSVPKPAQRTPTLVG